MDYEHCFTDMSTLIIDTPLDPPVFLYLKYENYYQNYRIYAKSLSLPQLQGESDPQLSKDCKPIVQLKDLDYSGTIYNYEGSEVLSGSVTSNPCGLIAASFINYTLSIDRQGKELEIDTDGIEWETYKVNKYKNTSPKQYLDKENNRFKVWMRTASTTSFLKLQGKINEVMTGEYNVSLTMGVDFLGADPRPCLYLSTANAMGGRNYVLGWAMFVCCLLSITWTCVFLGLNKFHTAITIEDAFNVNFDQF